MELSARRFPVEQNVEEIVKQAKHRWFNTAEVYKLFENSEKLHILALEPQEMPTSGSFFFIQLQRLIEFRKDGYVWSKKRDGKRIQESHENLRVKGVARLKCFYAYLETKENFQRRIYQLIEKKHVALFHYREVKNQENNRRGKKANHGAKEAIPTLMGTSSLGFPFNVESTGCSSGIANFQLPLGDDKPHYEYEFQNQPFSQDNEDHFRPNPDILSSLCEGAATGLPSFPGGNTPANLANAAGHHEIGDHLEDKNVGILAITDSQGSSSGIASYGRNQLFLLSQTTYTSNLNNIQGNVESAVSTDTSNHNNIQNNFSELLQSGMEIEDAGFSDTYYNIPFTGDDMQDYCNDFENQPLSHVIGNDILPNDGTLGSLCEMPELMESMEPFC